MAFIFEEKGNGLVEMFDRKVHPIHQEEYRNKKIH